MNQSKLLSLLKQHFTDETIRENDWVFKVLEASVMFFKNYSTRLKLYKLTGELDRAGLLCDLTTFVVYVTGKSATLHLYENFKILKVKFEEFCNDISTADFVSDIVEVESTDSDSHVTIQGFEEGLNTFRQTLDSYSSFRKSKIYKKFYKLFLYCMSFGIFDRFGMNFDKSGYTVFEKEALKTKYSSAPEFVYIALDSLTFLLQKGVQIIRLRRLDPIIHSAAAYTEWHEKASELKIQSTLLSNPEAHGFTEFSFRESLDKSIEQGEAIVRLAVDMEASERHVFRRILNDLKLTKCELTTRTAAREGREPPFSILICGASGIGKSTIKDLVHCHYAKIKNLDITPAQTYTRNPADQFWSGYTTSVWCIFMDDVAFRHPGRAPSGDSSVDEFLQVVNAVPFTPNQADLADKGRTPVRAKLVVATTNTEHLNAHYYFACPVAAQRRFPFILIPTVKTEYLSETGMLDSSKAITPEGEYPDFWDWTVKRVLVTESQRGVPAQTEIVLQTSNIYVLTDWLTDTIRTFEKNQKLTSQSVSAMKKITLCAKCSRPHSVCACLEACALCGRPASCCTCQMQSLAVAFGLCATAWACNFMAFWEIIAYSRNYLGIFIVSLLSELQVLAAFFGYPVWMCWTFRTTAATVRRYGDRVQRHLSQRRLMMGCAVLTTIYTVYKIYSAVKDFRNLQEENTELRNTVESHVFDVDCGVTGTDPAEVEGNVISQSGSKPQPLEVERENVWYNDRQDIVSHDLTRQITSSKSWTDAQVLSYFRSNCLGITIANPRKRKWEHSVIQCFQGNIYFANNHTIPDLEEFEIRLKNNSKTSGVSPNIMIKLKRSDLKRIPELDLVIFPLRNIPPRRGVREFLLKEPPQNFGNNGFIIGNTLEGEKFNLEAKCIRKTFNHLRTSFPDYVPPYMYMSTPSRETQNGECGSGLIARTGLGTIFLGIHIAKNDMYTRAYATPILSSYFDDLAFDTELIVQSGSMNLSSADKQIEVGPLHHKSVFRFIESGSADIYGTLSGFRCKPKTRVITTNMQKYLERFNYNVKFTAPTMNGWKPWRIAALDMVAPVWNYDNDILEKCKKHFYLDIIAMLDKKDYKMLQVYDNFTAINGAAGVTYVDRMKRTTSAGNPWKTSKKKFLLYLEPQHGLQDPVTYVPEIMDRVDDIIHKYEMGSCAHPCFCAHLKDEPVSFSKAERGKTRIFTGAPVDWSIVVRKYYLSMVRLIQNKRYAFEAAPGTVAQSKEWSDLYDYITAFGTDRIVAGDYKSFDKRMPPAFILAAFDIMIKLCHKSGNFTEEDLVVMRGISYDTAFPLVDFNGDLIQFYGSNPSGHPLTVIINCLVNSLYMRYVYYTLNPQKQVKTFKSRVSLMTYGDDNIMSVSDKIPWYNHTSISNAFKNMGIDYTMPDKEAESVPYISITQATFLKRGWRYDSEVGAYLAVLDHDSIEKMLTVWVRSRAVSEEEQAMSVISSAIREYFYYGKPTFEKRRVLFQTMINDLGLALWQEDWVLPTWEELRKAFWDASERLGVVPKGFQPAFPITSG